MNTEKTSLAKSYVVVDIIYKAGTPIALAALFFLKSQFVTKDQYEKNATRITEIETTLRIMAEQHHVNDRQDTTILDHESRIRKLESLIK